MNKTDLIAAAERAEGLPGPDREVFETAWLLIHHGGYEPEDEHDTCRKCDRFKRLLDAEAWLDAAMTLVPEGCAWAVTNVRGGEYEAFDFLVASAVVQAEPGLVIDYRSDAATPALAVTAAALRALAGAE